MAVQPKPHSEAAAKVLAAMEAARERLRANRATAASELPEADRLGQKMVAASERALDIANESKSSKDIVAAVAGLAATMKFCGLTPTSGSADAADDTPPTFRFEFAEPDRLDVPAEPEAPTGQTHPFPTLDSPDTHAEPGRSRRSA